MTGGDATPRRPHARDHRTERDRLSLADDDLLDDAVELRLVHDRRLVRLHLDERLAARDGVAWCLEPL